MERDFADEEQTQMKYLGSEMTALNLASYNYLGFAESDLDMRDEVCASMRRLCVCLYARAHAPVVCVCVCARVCPGLALCMHVMYGTPLCMHAMCVCVRVCPGPPLCTHAESVACREVVLDILSARH